MNKLLWAPWRHSYIITNTRNRNMGKKKSCFLCEAWKKPSSDKRNLVLYRSDDCFVIMNRYPYNNGHILIAPGRHCEDIVQMTACELAQVTDSMQLMIKILKKSLRTDGFNVGMNLGLVSGAGEKHVHLHIVPRWEGDTNFMPIFASTKIISQSLETLYTQLTKELKKTTK